MKLFILLSFLISCIDAKAIDEDFINPVKINKNSSFNISENLSRYIEGIKPVDVKLASQFYFAGKFRKAPTTNNEFLSATVAPKNQWLALEVINTTGVEAITVMQCIKSDVNNIDGFSINDI